MFKKKEDNDITKEKKVKEKKVKVVRAGVKHKSTYVLWVLMIACLAVSIYRNFTITDTRTVVERELVKQEVADTSAVENFTIEFAKIYHGWQADNTYLENRMAGLNQYMTTDLVSINRNVILSDVETSVNVDAVSIWKVALNQNDFRVVYKVNLAVKEGEAVAGVVRAYAITVHKDDNGLLVITQNPTPVQVQVKSDYEPKHSSLTSNVDSGALSEITTFLDTFFNIYPTITSKELAYYVRNDAVKPLESGYMYAGFDRLKCQLREDGKVLVTVDISLFDTLTKASNVSQYELLLEKVEDNWLIVG